MNLEPEVQQQMIEDLIENLDDDITYDDDLFDDYAEVGYDYEYTVDY